MSEASTGRAPSSQRQPDRSIFHLLLESRYWLYLLVLAAISSIDYAYLGAPYLDWLNPWVFLTIHEIHDALSLVPITLAARRYRGRGGYVASAWFALVHSPHYYLVWPDTGRMARLLVVCAIGGFTSYLIDVYQKQSREKEKAYQDMLAARERLSHLDEMFQLEKMHAMGGIAAGVAHDFNNILAAVLFQAEVALRLTKEESVRPYLQNIQQAALDGTETVKRIREFTRTQPALEGMGLVDLRKVIENAVDMSQPHWKDQAQARGATIQMKVSLEDSPTIRGNAAQLCQVLVNLIINAAEALPRGGDIQIRAVKKNGAVALLVADNGEGMDEATARRALEPFFTTKGPHNSGLGLSAAYGIVARHGGRLTLESKKAHGTTVTISLPTGEEEPGAVAPALRQGLPSRKLDILVVDDEPLVAQGLAELLRLEGHTVSVHTSATQALSEFHRNIPDAVFTDLGMPGMNGWQLCAAIKKSSPETPVVMLTGWGEEAATEVRLAPVDFLLSKPVAADKLDQVVREIGSRLKAHRPSA